MKLEPIINRRSISLTVIEKKAIKEGMTPITSLPAKFLVLPLSAIAKIYPQCGAPKKLKMMHP